jgi:hypothetical protein
MVAGQMAAQAHKPRTLSRAYITQKGIVLLSIHTCCLY